MKKILYIIFSVFCLFNCSKPEPQVNNDEYYVKYVFSCQVVQYKKVYTTPYLIKFTNSNLKEDTRSYETVNEEEISCGPFKYGDKLKISLEHYYHDNVGGSSQAQTLIDIYVSKNNSPFALKKTKSSSSQEPYTTLLEYIIDY